VNTLAAFDVIGLPAPQGSKTAIRVGNAARVIEGGSTSGRVKHKAWRAAVAEAARSVADDKPYDGALALSITFRMPMPASRPKFAQVLGKIPHIVKPDKDKLIRCTLDALTDAGLIRDDARIYKLDVEAFEVVGWTGAEIVLREATTA
jgi:Holliday junction resolvase RusA-like endonuclease